MTQRVSGRTSGMMLVLCSIVALVIGVGLGIQRAAAMWHEVQETGQPGYLQLQSDVAPGSWRKLRVDEPLHWQIEASLEDAPESSLALELRSEGALVNAGSLLVSATACTAPFTPGDTPACDAEEQVVLDDTVLASVAQSEHGQVYSLGRLTAEHPRYVLVSLQTAPSVTAAQIASESMRLGVGLHATGEAASEPAPQPTMTPAPPSDGDEPRVPGQLEQSHQADPKRVPDALATTGADVAIVVLVLGGLGALAAGSWLIRRSRGQGQV